MRYPYPLFFACSTCSGVPPFHNSLIYKGFADGARWNTDSVPACSKVFHVFRFRRIHRAGEMAANPRQPWPAANSGRSTSAPAAGAQLDAPARRNAPRRRPGRARFGTTTDSPSPAGPWSPRGSTAPAPAPEAPLDSMTACTQRNSSAAHSRRDGHSPEQQVRPPYSRRGGGIKAQAPSPQETSCPLMCGKSPL